LDIKVVRMKIRIVECDRNKIEFVVDGATPALINALRRVIIAEVPTLAIEDVIFYENSSALYDEIIAHRLGLIPLTTDLRSFNLPEKCKCNGKGCSLCRVTFFLEKEGEGVVYSGDLKSEDPKVKPVYENIPIVKLGKGQKISLEAIAILGRGRDHAKWSPAANCYFKYYPKISIDEKKCDACKKCVDVCPRNILEFKKGKISAKNIEECIFCKECEMSCEKKAIKIGYENNKFIFYLESTEALAADEIVKEALKVLDEKLNDLEAQIKEKL